MPHSNHSWLPVLAELMENSTPCVLITVTEARGSTPREAGTKMVVTEKEQFGTIGGGNLEFDAIKEARELLGAVTAATKQKRYALGPTLAQCCGGSVSVLLEPFIGMNKRIFLFGAGHVGREVVDVLSALPVQIIWVDERENEFPKTIAANAEKRVMSDPVKALDDAGEDDFIVIMTHNHDLDYALIERAFDLGVFAYLGLIGSDTKRARFESRLVKHGVKKPDLKRLTCPIGVEGVTGKHPREIAIAVSAELLSLGLTHHTMSS